jgi:hypothetical protein
MAQQLPPQHQGVAGLAAGSPAVVEKRERTLAAQSIVRLDRIDDTGGTGGARAEACENLSSCVRGHVSLLSNRRAMSTSPGPIDGGHGLSRPSVAMDPSRLRGDDATDWQRHLLLVVAMKSGSSCARRSKARKS